MARLVWRISARQIDPLRSGAKDPKDPVEHFSRMTSWPSRTPLAHVLVGQVTADDFPLLILEVHPHCRSEIITSVDPLATSP